MLPGRHVWRHLPQPLRHRLWPHLLALRGLSAPPPVLRSDLAWSVLDIAGHEVAFPPIGSSAERLNQELADATKVGSPRPTTTIVMLGPIEWAFRLQRPQKLAIELARQGYRVIYVNPTARLNKDIRVDFTQVARGVFSATISVPSVVPPYDAVLATDRTDLYIAALEILRSTAGVLDAWVAPMLPFWVDLAIAARSSWGWQIWYDRMDHWEGFERVGRAYGAAEARLLDHAEVLTVTAAALIPASGANLIPNACDEGFARLPVVSRQPWTDARARVGYVGAIAEWFDVAAVAEVAALPNIAVELYGAVSPEADVSALRQMWNVTFHGEIPHSKVCDAIDSLDVCLLPFELRPLTLSTDPVKVYEYLARGKPVVASALPELQRFASLVAIASGAADFAGCVTKALAAEERDKSPGRRASVVSHTWTARASAVDALLRAATPTISVIILNWNNAALTAASIRTLLATNDYPNVEIVCVDNYSAEPDREHLDQLLLGIDRIRLVWNPANLGFAGGMNSGVEASTGDIIVLLNNDAFIGPGGLNIVEAHLRDGDVGLLGAVTNWTGNEARLPIDPKSFGEFLRVCLRERLDHAGESADVANIAFFCVALRRSVWDRIGSLDDRFGIGMFEDDDYCRRMAQEGLKVRIARDWFVYHVGEASFSLLKKSGSYDRLFEQNRALFETKWKDRWTPHTAHPLRTVHRPFSQRTSIGPTGERSAAP